MLYYFSLFFILYLPFQIALNPVSGIDLASGRILAAAIFLGWLALGLKRRKIILGRGLGSILVLSFLFLSLFSIFFADNQVWAWKKILFLFSFWPLYFVFSDFAQDQARAEKIGRFLAYSGMLASAAALTQFALQFILGLDGLLGFWRGLMPLFLGQAFSQSVLGYSSWLVNISGATLFRAIAFFPDPHMLSLFLGLVFPWSLTLAIQKSSAKEKNSLFFWLGTLLILLADLFTFSRGGYLGLLGGFLILFYWLIQKYRQQFAPYFIIFLLLLGSGILVPNPLRERMISSLNLTEGSNQERLKNWNEALSILRDRPLVGTGIGNYSLTVKPSAQYREPIYAHNLYLDIMAETGVINGLIFIFLVFSAAFSFLKKSRHAIFYLGGGIGLLIFATHSIFETGLFSVQVLPILVIVLALGNAQKNADKNN